MNNNLIRNAAHYFRVDEARIKKFIHEFFAANDLDAAMAIMDEFSDEVCASTTREELDDFCTYISSRKEETENLLDNEREIEEELEACQKCAYNDCGFCSCYEKKSICCPYADDEEEGD